MEKVIAAVTALAVGVGIGWGAGIHSQPGKKKLSEKERFARYHKLCSKNNLFGCIAEGWFYASGKQVTRNYKVAVALFLKACSGGNLEGCLSLGDMYEKGRGVPQKLSYALDLYKFSCENGYAPACKFYNRLKGRLSR
ncbi:MAG: tetratricopeptide repeat protein [Campylobacterales bacterium]